MTRFLSESLQAKEPYFRQQLQQLEKLHFHPHADIRLTLDVMNNTRAKLTQLGLDPHDTTATELYEALKSRMARDEKHVTKQLRTRAATHISAEADVMAGLMHLLRAYQGTTSYFSLKHTVLKRYIKRSPPKKVMRRLGYRSVDSLLRHEAPALILAAAQYLETTAWWNSYSVYLKQVAARDFESRPISILYPTSERWNLLAQEMMTEQEHTILISRELAAVVILPLPANGPIGSVMKNVIHAVLGIASIKTTSSYLSICQVQPDFGLKVQAIMSREALLTTHLLDQPVPWALIQRTISSLPRKQQEEMLDYRLAAADVHWKSLGKYLQELESTLHFWMGSEHLAAMYGSLVVSLHPLDVVVNMAQGNPLHKSDAQYFRQSLWNELVLKYLHPSTVEETLRNEFHPKLAPAYAVQ